MSARRRVACLHTADSNIPIFEAAKAGLDLDLQHILRADLLAAASRAGGLDASIVAETEKVLTAAAREADFVLLACSTLGPVADNFTSAVPVLRIDRALAETAVAQGGRVAVLYSFPGTRAASEQLFREVAAAARTGAAIDMQLVPEAWEVFTAGDQQRYSGMVATAADRAIAQGADVVAFAQASMSPAADLCGMAKPLTSPRAGLLAAAR